MWGGGGGGGGALSETDRTLLGEERRNTLTEVLLFSNKTRLGVAAEHGLLSPSPAHYVLPTKVHACGFVQLRARTRRRGKRFVHACLLHPGYIRKVLSAQSKMYHTLSVKLGRVVYEPDMETPQGPIIENRGGWQK